MTEVLNRDYGLKNYIDPMGRKLVAAKTNAENSLWTVAVEKDGKPFRYTGSLPDYLNGTFTTADRVRSQIVRYLTELWDKSDAQAIENKRGKVANG